MNCIHKERSWGNTVMNSGGALQSHSALRYLEILHKLIFSQCLEGVTHCSWLWIIKDSFKNKGSFIVLVELFFKDGGLLLSIFLPFPLFISSVLHSLALLLLTSYKHTHPLAIESFIWTTGSMLYICVLDHNWDENILRSWLLCSTIQVLYWTLIEKYEQHVETFNI